MVVLLRHYPEKEKEEGGDEEESWEKDREIDKKGERVGGPGGFNDFARRLLGPQGSRVCWPMVAGDGAKGKWGSAQVLRCAKEGGPR
jgi:hypothetical protein